MEKWHLGILTPTPASCLGACGRNGSLCWRWKQENIHLWEKSSGSSTQQDVPACKPPGPSCYHQGKQDQENLENFQIALILALTDK